MNEWVSWSTHIYSRSICPSKEFLLIQWGRSQNRFNDQSYFHMNFAKAYHLFSFYTPMRNVSSWKEIFLLLSPYPAPWWAAQECLSWWPGSRVGGPDRHEGAVDRHPGATYVHVVCSSPKEHRSFPEKTEGENWQNDILSKNQRAPSSPLDAHRRFWASGLIHSK